MCFKKQTCLAYPRRIRIVLIHGKQESIRALRGADEAVWSLHFHTYKKPYFVMHPLDCRRHHRHKCLKVLWKHSFCLAGRICVTIFASDLAAFYSSIPVLRAAFFIFHKQSGWKKVHISRQLRAFASRISHSGQVSKHSSLRNDITDYLGHNF